MSGEFAGQLVTVREAARLLCAHENTIRWWNDKGIIQAIRVGSKRHRRFYRQDIENLRLRMLNDGGHLPEEYLSVRMRRNS